jgi:hypothetical protein
MREFGFDSLGKLAVLSMHADPERQSSDNFMTTDGEEKRSI